MTTGLAIQKTTIQELDFGTTVVLAHESRGASNLARAGNQEAHVYNQFHETPQQVKYLLLRQVQVRSCADLSHRSTR